MRGRPSDPTVPYPGGGRDSRPPRFAPIPLVGRQRRSPIDACACRRSWRWRRVLGGTWVALWRKMFDHSPRHALARTPARTAAL
eukprot:6211807-Pleurochrysis_carterae.AAC.1